MPFPPALPAPAEVQTPSRLCPSFRPSAAALLLPLALRASGTNGAPGEAGCNHSDSSSPEQICLALGRGRKGLFKGGASSWLCIRLMEPGRFSCSVLHLRHMQQKLQNTRKYPNHAIPRSFYASAVKYNLIAWSRAVSIHDNSFSLCTHPPQWRLFQ